MDASSDLSQKYREKGFCKNAKILDDRKECTEWCSDKLEPKIGNKSSFKKILDYRCCWGEKEKKNKDRKGKHCSSFCDGSGTGHRFCEKDVIKYRNKVMGKKKK